MALEILTSRSGLEVSPFEVVKVTIFGLLLFDILGSIIKNYSLIDIIYGDILLLLFNSIIMKLVRYYSIILLSNSFQSMYDLI